MSRRRLESGSGRKSAGEVSANERIKLGRSNIVVLEFDFGLQHLDIFGVRHAYFGVRVVVREMSSACDLMSPASVDRRILPKHS